MYEQQRKRRVKFIKFDIEQEKIDLGNYRQLVEIEKNKLTNDRNFPDPRLFNGNKLFFGWFVGYGLDLQENNEGQAFVNFTVAIVETDDQKVELIDVRNIEFI